MSAPGVVAVGSGGVGGRTWPERSCRGGGGGGHEPEGRSSALRNQRDDMQVD